MTLHGDQAWIKEWQTGYWNHKCIFFHDGDRIGYFVTHIVYSHNVPITQLDSTDKKIQVDEVSLSFGCMSGKIREKKAAEGM